MISFLRSLAYGVFLFIPFSANRSSCFRKNNIPVLNRCFVATRRYRVWSKETKYGISIYKSSGVCSQLFRPLPVRTEVTLSFHVDVFFYFGTLYSKCNNSS